MAGTDPSTNLVPGTKNFVPPPSTPDSLSVGASSPTDTQQNLITTGYDQPSRVRLAASQLKQQTAAPNVEQTGGAAKPPPAAAPAASAATPIVTPSAVTDILAQPDPRFDAFWTRMVPGESGGKNVPNERYDATHTASGPAQITDTNWHAYAPKLGIDINLYPTAMSAPPEWQKAVTKLFFRAEGQAPWDTAHGGALPVNPGTAADAYWQGQVSTIQKGYQERYEKTSKNLQDAINQLRAGDGDIGKAMERIRAAQDKADRAQDEAYRAIEQQPKAPVIDGVKHLNSIAVIVGLLGGLMTKAPMLASTNAAAAAIEAYNAGDLRAYNMAHDNWKNQTDLLFKIADANASRVRSIIEEEKLPIEEKRARLDAMLRINGQQDLAEQIRLQGMEIGLQYWQENQRLQNERTRIMEERDKGIPLEIGTNPDGSKKYGLFHPISNTMTDMPGTPVNAAIAAGRQRQGELTPDDRAQVERDLEAWLQTDEGAKASQTDIENKRYDLGSELIRKKAALKRDEYGPAKNVQVIGDGGKILWPEQGGMASARPPKDPKKPWLDESGNPLPAGHVVEQGSRGQQAGQAPELTYPEKWEGMPNKPPPGVRADIWSFALNYVQTGKLPPLGMGASPQRLQFEAAIPAAQHALGISPSDQGAAYIEYQARQRRATSVESAFGGGVTGRNMISLNTVADHLALFKEYADALASNADTTVINSILDRMATMTGAPEIINFALAGTITGDEVVRLLTTTGGTHEDRAGLQALLSPYGSPPQIYGAIQTASRFVASRYQPLEQQYVSGDPTHAQERRDFFNNWMVTPAAHKLFQETRPGGAQGGAGGGGGTTTYKTRDDVGAAYKAGKISYDQAKQILHDQFGDTE